MARWTTHCLAERDKIPGDRFADIWFKNTLVDLIAPVKRSDDYVVMQPAAGAGTAMEDWQEENRRDHRAAHDYTRQQYGLSNRDD